MQIFYLQIKLKCTTFVHSMRKEFLEK
jgi:hypothetical protein